MARADLMVFVHIPKCAGTALNTWLALSHHYGNLYVKESNVPFTALRWEDINPASLGDLRLRSVASHHLRTYPAFVQGRSLRYITILREPIFRWISHVRFFKLLQPDESQPPRPLREYAEWLLDQPATAVLDQVNGQTNFIAEHEWYRLEREERPVINWDAEPELFARYTRERLELARKTLQRFDAVGTVDRLDDFTRVLQVRAVDWDVPLIPIEGLEPTLVTVAPAVDASWITPNDSVGRRLLEAFAEDFELYRIASELISASVTERR